MLTFPDGTPVPDFRPCIIEVLDLMETEVLLEDCAIAWSLLGNGWYVGRSIESGVIVGVRVPAVGLVDHREATA